MSSGESQVGCWAKSNQIDVVMLGTPLALGSEGGRLWCLLGTRQSNKRTRYMSVEEKELVIKQRTPSTPLSICHKICRSLFSVRPLLLLNDVIPSAGKTVWERQINLQHNPVTEKPGAHRGFVLSFPVLGDAKCSEWHNSHSPTIEQFLPGYPIGVSYINYTTVWHDPWRANSEFCAT